MDDELLEKSLIENGLAKVYYIYGDYAHLDELREAEAIAKSKKIGIWSDSEESIKEEKDDTFTKIINLIVEILQKIIAFLFK